MRKVKNVMRNTMVMGGVVLLGVGLFLNYMQGQDYRNREEGYKDLKEEDEWLVRFLRCSEADD